MAIFWKIIQKAPCIFEYEHDFKVKLMRSGPLGGPQTVMISKFLFIRNQTVGPADNIHISEVIRLEVS